MKNFVVILFCFYSIIGFIPLLWASRAHYRWEYIATGMFLIFFAAFVLTALSVADSSVADILTATPRTSNTGNNLTQARNYVSFFVYLFTFLYGGVGVNMLSTGLRADTECSQPKEINTLIWKIDQIEKDIRRLKQMSRFYFLFICILLALLGVGLLLWGDYVFSS